MKHLSYLALVATVVAAGTAAAARPTDGIATEMSVARCVVDNDGLNVRKLLETLPGSPDERRVAVPLVELYGACHDNSPATGTFAWRERAELAAEAATRRAARGTRGLANAADQSGWELTPIAEKAAGVDYGSGSVGLRMFGDCVVRAAPEPALDLLMSEPGSGAEAAAAAKLEPTLGHCLFAGQQLSIERADLRLVVAEPLYHLLSR
jgi:hypothetical protein